MTTTTAKTTHTVDWENDKSFRFQGERINLRRTQSDKKIYLGQFIDQAPPGLQCGVTYCLKKIDVPTMGLDAPQAREYFDLADLQGGHLRQILARNSAAQACADELKKTGACQPRENCCIVEPAYRSTNALFENCRRYSVSQRLDIVLQYAMGSQELTHECNKLGGFYIQAHRDLKGGNGVMELLENGIRIRLIDFASIRLNKDSVGSILMPRLATLPDDTCGCAMSPTNTAPEDLHKSPYKVTGKTDVYALGMLLAALFLCENGRYVNPSTLWVNDHGWSDTTNTGNTDTLLNSFNDCNRRYEPTATWKQSWIESDLKANKHVRHWEKMPDRQVLTAIRKLFFHATRIDPKNRLNLPSFIQTVKDIITMEKNSPAKIPVSLYLFDQTHFDRHYADYLRAARIVMDKEKQVKGAAAQALCVAYRNAIPTDRKPAEAVTLLPGTPFDNQDTLTAALSACHTRNGPGANMLSYAVLQGSTELIRRLSTPDSRYVFTGHIHLFAPEIPAISAIATVPRYSDDPKILPVKLDLHDICNQLTLAFNGTILRITAYTAAPPDPFSEDAPWYNHIPLRSATEQISAPQDSRDVKSAASQDDPTQVRPTPSRDTDTRRADDIPAAQEDSGNFYDGPNDYYIELDDGGIAYIGMK